ncbi:hypothetical protein BH11MYX1_BH11MYX1_08540 [soil metagenome]
MTTTTIALATFATAALVAGCTGNFGGGNKWTAPDATETAAACDSPEIKTMDITVSGASMTLADKVPTGCWNLKGKLTVNGSTASLKDVLGDLRQFEDLVLTNTMVTTIDTVAPLAVTRSLDVENNTVLTSLANVALPNDASCLTYLGSITIKGNQALTDLGGVSKAMCVAGLTQISNNVELAAVTLDAAARLEGGLEVTYNTRMTALSFTQLASVGSITIANNDALTAIGTVNAANIQGDLLIDSNKSLSKMPAITKAQTTAHDTSDVLVISGALMISNNEALSDLGNWSHAGQVLGTHSALYPNAITIKNNKNLPVCEAREVGCCVAHADTAQINIGNSGNSCNSGPHSWCYSSGCYNYSGN